MLEFVLVCFGVVSPRSLSPDCGDVCCCGHAAAQPCSKSRRDRDHPSISTRFAAPPMRSMEAPLCVGLGQLATSQNRHGEAARPMSSASAYGRSAVQHDNVRIIFILTIGHLAVGCKPGPAIFEISRRAWYSGQFATVRQSLIPDTSCARTGSDMSRMRPTSAIHLYHRVQLVRLPRVGLSLGAIMSRLLK